MPSGVLLALIVVMTGSWKEEMVVVVVVAHVVRLPDFISSSTA